MILKGSVWKCIDEDMPEFGRLCVVKDVNDDPGYNGDGDIEVMFSDGSILYTKVRRFHNRFEIRRGSAE